MALASGARSTRSQERDHPQPSDGVFAEAVLGQLNAAERVDLALLELAGLANPDRRAGHCTGSDGQPRAVERHPAGSAIEPVLTIQNPTAFPDSIGVAAILSAIQQGNMFRDMSGLAQTAALAQAGVRVVFLSSSPLQGVGCRQGKARSL